MRCYHQYCHLQYHYEMTRIKIIFLVSVIKQILLWNQYQTNINTVKTMQKCHSLKMSNALLSSILSSTISFPFVMFAFDFLAFARALHRCLPLAKTFSTFTKNGRSSTELLYCVNNTSNTTQTF